MDHTARYLMVPIIKTFILSFSSFASLPLLWLAIQNHIALLYLLVPPQQKPPFTSREKDVADYFSHPIHQMNAYSFSHNLPLLSTTSTSLSYSSGRPPDPLEVRKFCFLLLLSTLSAIRHQRQVYHFLVVKKNLSISSLDS